jgi:hypothetical protein
MEHSMTISVTEAARMLKLSADMVRRLDAQLEAIRDERGHRRYRRDVVERVAARRAARHGRAGT